MCFNLEQTASCEACICCQKTGWSFHAHCKEAQKPGNQCAEELFTLFSIPHVFVDSRCLILSTSPGPFLGSTELLLLLQPWHSFHKATSLDDGIQKLIILQTQDKSNALSNLRMWDINFWYPESRLGTHCAAECCPWEDLQVSEGGEELFCFCQASYAICFCHLLRVASSFLPLQSPLETGAGIQEQGLPAEWWRGAQENAVPQGQTRASMPLGSIWSLQLPTAVQNHLVDWLCKIWWDVHLKGWVAQQLGASSRLSQRMQCLSLVDPCQIPASSSGTLISSCLSSQIVSHVKKQASPTGPGSPSPLLEY